MSLPRRFRLRQATDHEPVAGRVPPWPRAIRDNSERCAALRYQGVSTPQSIVQIVLQAILL